MKVGHHTGDLTEQLQRMLSFVEGSSQDASVILHRGSDQAPQDQRKGRLRLETRVTKLPRMNDHAH